MRIELDRAELNAAWRAADLPNLPPTLTGGRSADTPIDASLARLRDQGLIGSDGAVAADLRDALDDFAHAPFEIDVRIGPDLGTEIRAVVTVRRNAAVLAVRNGDQVTLRRLPAKVAVTALVDVLPAAEPARGVRVSLPMAEVDTAITNAMARLMDETGAGSDAGVVGGLTARGVASVDANLFISLVSSDNRLRFATFGVAARDRYGARHRSTRVVRAVDTPRGRAALYTSGHYVVATPADSATFVRVLTELRDAETDRLGTDRFE